MADLPASGQQAMLAGMAGFGPSFQVSLHTGSPGTTGANECSGGGYARQLASFAVVGNYLQNTAAITFSVAAVAVVGFGIWNTTTGGYAYFAGGTVTVTGTPTAITFAAGTIQLAVS